MKRLFLFFLLASSLASAQEPALGPYDFGVAPNGQRLYYYSSNGYKYIFSQSGGQHNWTGRLDSQGNGRLGYSSAEKLPKAELKRIATEQFLDIQAGRDFIFNPNFTETIYHVWQSQIAERPFQRDVPASLVLDANGGYMVLFVSTGE